MSTSAGQPNCYDDRETFRDSDDYVFISYSHADRDAVYADLARLYDENLNFWYDKQLKAGDDWDQKVATKLADPHCAGVILYLSPNSAKSEAVEEELKLYKKKTAEDASFFLIPVSVNGMGLSGVVRQIYLDHSSLAEGELESVFPLTRFANLVNAFTTKKIFIPRAEDLSHLGTLLGSLPEDKHIFCSSDAALRRLSDLPCLHTENGNLFLTLGEYPQSSLKDPDPYVENAPLVVRGGKKLRVRKHIRYVYEPTVWRYVKNDNETITVISELALDYARFEDIDKTLDEFLSAAFTDDARACIKRIRLPQLNDLRGDASAFGEAEMSAYCRAKRTSLAFYCWATDETGTPVSCYHRDGDIVADSADDSRGYTCALRPCIELDIDKLAETSLENK